jgi:DNA helicase-2/ATP-dependent DNA helicase PcrA
MDLKKQLNPSQFAAVTTINGPVLVIAGAGSGKTRVIEYRVLHLIQNNISPNSILLLTFTRNAAREMSSRSSKHDPLCKNIEGGTFHSFGYKILKRYAKTMGFPDAFTVLDESDAEEAIRKCCTDLGFFEKEKRFPRKDTLRNIISISVNKYIPVSEVIKKEYPHFLEYSAEIETLRQKYAEYKINSNYLDYDDMLIYLRLLLENDDIRDRLSQRYKYIMVDEYQDTNRLQGDITYLLAEKNRNIMVVGDDAQSIYGFRGASHENIMGFPKRFPECKIIKLEENYRSSQSILDVANAVLENMKNKYSKCLVSAKKMIGEKPRLLYFSDAYNEADWIANRIKEERDEGVPFGHQCVLFRSSYLSIPLQAELSRRNIPFIVFGGMKFYEMAHVKDVMAHLKVLANTKDQLAWNRVLMLIEGIGPKISGRILREIIACPSPQEIFEKVFQKYHKGYSYSEGMEKLEPALRTASDASLQVGEKFDIILDYYHPILRDKFDDWHLRANDLETFRQISMRYTSLEELLVDFAIEPPERGIWRIEPSTPEEEKPLTLSTIHGAKGLEWESVFLIGLMDGVLPVAFALNDEDEIEEENRLFYVGVTRAKNRLYLSLHHEGSRGGITQFNKMSRFLDIPSVFSKLEPTGIPRQRMKQIDSREDEEETLYYDKESLYRRIMDFLK